MRNVVVLMLAALVLAIPSRLHAQTTTTWATLLDGATDIPRMMDVYESCGFEGGSLAVAGLATEGYAPDLIVGGNEIEPPADTLRVTVAATRCARQTLSGQAIQEILLESNGRYLLYRPPTLADVYDPLRFMHIRIDGAWEQAASEGRDLVSRRRYLEEGAEAAPAESAPRPADERFPPAARRISSRADGAPPASLRLADASCVPGQCTCVGEFDEAWKLDDYGVSHESLAEGSTCLAADFDRDDDWDAVMPGGEGF